MFASGAYLLVCDFPTDPPTQNVAVTGTAQLPKITQDVLHEK